MIVLNRVLGIQYLDSRRAYTLFLLLHRLSPEGTMSMRPTHDLGWSCNWTDRGSPQSAFHTLGPALNGNFRYTSVILLNDKCREVKRIIAT